MTSTADIIAGFYNLRGITTESVLNVLTVNELSSQVALNNPNRVGGLFINTSTADIYLGYAPNPTSSNGILLVPSGGSFNTLITSDFALTGYAVYAAATADGSTLLFLETQLNN